MICAIVDTRIPAPAKRRLAILGFKVIEMPAEGALPAPIASHPDMLMFKHHDRIIANTDYCEKNPYIFSDIREYSQNTEMTFTDEAFGEKYPFDAIFNVLTVGRYAFLKADTASAAVKDYLLCKGLEIINVNQGYPACTVLAFGNSAITADRGMAKAMSQCGIDVTLIDNGAIMLPPYEYGFIGGASGVFGDKIYFIGNIDAHPNADIIKEAILREGYTPISLCDSPLFDGGRIIFVE